MPARSRAHADRGIGVLEVLIAVAMLAVVSVVVISVQSARSDAATGTCSAEKRALITASEAFFAKGARTIPDAGGDDGYEQTLVDQDFLVRTSEHFDLDADGVVHPAADSPCAA